jgi:DNA (cytosine-5)-methyltransferase 1
MILKQGKWNLSDLKSIQKRDVKVFSCFSCGGGSTMGYKLSGCDVLGCVEIDQRMIEMYIKNHHPKYPFLMSVTDFLKVKDEELPKELFNLDILDGSPPCSSFSISGNREDNWGDKKKFREGQEEQVLDDLFFYFIKIAEKLKPKVVIAENVKGLIQGLAKGYVKEIFSAFKKAGYSTQLFLLNSARMGVPQYRERTFFIANNLGKKISLSFNEKEIPLKEAFVGCKKNGKELTPLQKKLWLKSDEGSSFSKAHHKGSFFNSFRLSRVKPCQTITANSGSIMCHYDSPRELSNEEIAVIQTFPMDYDYLKNKTKYVCGMSVPPFMMNRLSDEVVKQFFNK